MCRNDASSGVRRSCAIYSSPSCPLRPYPSGGSLRHMAQKVVHTEAEWREILTPEQYAVLREKATERPWSGEYCSIHATGMYRCAACKTPLFESGTKFESGSGWPSFFQPVS